MKQVGIFTADITKFIAPLEGLHTFLHTNIYYRYDYYNPDSKYTNNYIGFGLKDNDNNVNNLKNIEYQYLECDKNDCTAYISGGNGPTSDDNTFYTIFLNIPKYSGTKRLIKFSYNGIHLFSVMQVSQHHIFVYNMNYTSSSNTQGDNTLTAIKGTAANLYNVYIRTGIVTKPPTNTNGMNSLSITSNIEKIIIGVESIKNPSLFSDGTNLYSALNGAIGGPNGTGFAVPKVPDTLKDEVLIKMKYYYTGETINELNTDDNDFRGTNNKTNYFVYAVNKNTNICYIIATMQTFVEYSHVIQGNYES